MTKIDFYVLDAAARGDRYQLCCRIAEKARRAGHRVLIHTPLDAEATHIDGLFWTFWEQGFVPHGRIGRDDPELNPIMIGDGQADEARHEVLINLESEVPLFFSRFERLIECVDHDDAIKAASRQRFRYYREHGYPLASHTIT
jgi:DNA polymerase-3 subunit chi